MKLVQFEDGEFGIRKFSFFHAGFVYFDLRDQDYWWGRKSKYFRNCRVPEEKAREIFKFLTDKGKRIK